jgi:outer membrane protein assembly factor BamA
MLFAGLCAVLLSGAGSAESLRRKTGKALGKAAEKVMEPIRNPQSAFTTWFEFDPRIESGEKANFNILPLFVSSPERGQGFGVKLARESLFKNKDIIRVQAIQTIKNRSSYRLGYELPPDLISANFGGEFEIGYENYGQFYYGMGNRAKEDDRSDYTPEFFDARLPLLYRLKEHIFTGLSFSFENWSLVEVEPNGILRRDLPSLAGRDGSRLFTTGILARWDSRDSRSNPSQGVYAEGRFERAKQLRGTEDDFNRTTVEARHYIPLGWRKGHILAGRLYMDYHSGDVPFYHLPGLGGIFFTRGLIEGRYRDNLALCGNLEYRLPIYQRLHWAFFADAGNVYPEFKSVNPERIKVTGGTGMRYYVPPGNLLLARVDLGYSEEGLLTYLTFDHPF